MIVLTDEVGILLIHDNSVESSIFNVNAVEVVLFRFEIYEEFCYIFNSIHGFSDHYESVT